MNSPSEMERQRETERDKRYGTTTHRSVPITTTAEDPKSRTLSVMVGSRSASAARPLPTSICGWPVVAYIYCTGQSLVTNYKGSTRRGITETI